MDSLLRSPIIQPKLTISQPSDVSEREAIRVADQVMRMPDARPAIQRAAPQIRRKCLGCEKEQEEKATIVRAKRDIGALTGPSGVNATSVSPLDVIQTGGRPLDQSVRSSMESRFQRDFGKVRIHTDARAAQSAQRLSARAYTTGTNIVFGAGEYSPHTPAGASVLAHELTHVVQQEGATPWSAGVETLAEGGQSVRVLPPLGQRGDAFEREAEVMPKRSDSLRQMQGTSLQRIELPRPLPICGAMVTDVDILPPRPRALVECGLPPTVMVTRVNIVGRQRTAASTGRGRIIFNLHIGYYTDPATGRYCAVASDSTRCLTPGGCISLGCLPTLKEILDAILDFLKFLGAVILFILLVRFLRGVRIPTGGPISPPIIAGGPEPERENIET